MSPLAIYVPGILDEWCDIIFQSVGPFSKTKVNLAFTFVGLSESFSSSSYNPLAVAPAPLDIS